MMNRAYGQGYTFKYLAELRLRYIKIEVQSRILAQHMYQRIRYWQKIKGIN